MREAASKERGGIEPRHPIQVVARRTGLTPDVIRVWERRYGAVSPGRSGANRRLYSDRDLERLLLLRRATLAGRAIGNVARLESAELRTLVESDEAAMRHVPQKAAASIDPSAGGRLESCLEALRVLDAPRLRSLLNAAAIEMAAPALMQQVLVPLMRTVGEEWQRGSMRIHHEHLATALVRALLDSLRDGHTRSFGGPDIVVATPAEEPHELGALMASVVAAAEGWNVRYLGPNLPAAEIANAALGCNARAVALSLVYLERDTSVVQGLRELREQLPKEVQILVGGKSSAAYEDVLREIAAVRCEDMARFRTELERLRPASR